MAGKVLDIPGPTDEELQGTELGVNPYTMPFLEDKGTESVPLEGLTGTVERQSALEAGQGQSWFGVGEKEAYAMQLVKGFNDMVAGTGDAVLNAIIDSYPPLREEAEKDGIDEVTRSQHPEVARDYLQRYFNKGDYESVQYIFPKLAKWFSENVPDIEGMEDVGRAIAAFNKHGAGEKIGIPDNWQSRLFRTSGQMGAATIPFAGIAARTSQLATSGYRAAQEMLLRQRLAESPRLAAGQASLTGGLGILRQATTAPYASSPAGAPLLEGLYGVLSGGGMEAEHEIFGTTTGIGGIAPIVLPSTLLYLAQNGPTGWAIKKLWNLGKKADQVVRDKVLERTEERMGLNPDDPADTAAATDARTVEARNKVVAKIEEEISTPEAQASIERAKQIELELDPYADSPIGFSPGEASQLPGLLAMQAATEARSPIGSPFSIANSERKANILTAAARFKEDKLPTDSVPDTPMVIYNAVKGRYETTLGRMDEVSARLDDQLNLFADDTDGLLPRIATGERHEGGAAIRARIKSKKEDIMKEADALAKKLNINEADQVIGMDHFLAAQARAKEFLPRDAEGSLSYKNMHRVFKDFINHEGKLSFQDWKAFRGQVGDALGTAIANERGSDIRSLTHLREVMDEMAENGAFAATAGKFAKFREWYKVHYMDPFEPVMHILTPRAQGGSSYLIPDESVAKAFFQSAEGGRTFKDLFSDNPAMMKHMEAAALDSARDAALRRTDKLIDPDALDIWINKNGSTLDALGMRESFEDSQVLVQNLSNRALQLAGRRKRIVQSELYKKIMSAERTDNPDDLISQIFVANGNVRLATDLRGIAEREAKRTGDDTYIQAFNASIVDKIFKSQPNWMDNPANFKNYIAKNERILDAALTKDHVDRLYLLADAYERAISTGMREGKTDISTFLSRFEQEVGFTTANASNRIIALREGRLGPRGIAAYFLSRAINAQSMKRVNSLWEAAILDRNLARTLTQDIPASLPVGAITPKTRDYIHLYLYNLGVPFGEPFYTNPGEGEPIQLNFQSTYTPSPPNPNITVRPVLSSPPQTVPGPQTEATTPTPAPVQLASSPTPPVNVESVFPFDADLQAIENRRNAASNQGLASLA